MIKNIKKPTCNCIHYEMYQLLMDLDFVCMYVCMYIFEYMYRRKDIMNHFIDQQKITAMSM